MAGLPRTAAEEARRADDLAHENAILRLHLARAGRGLLSAAEREIAVHADSADKFARIMVLAHAMLPEGHPKKLTRDEVAALTSVSEWAYYAIREQSGGPERASGDRDLATVRAVAIKLAALTAPVPAGA